MSVVPKHYGSLVVCFLLMQRDTDSVGMNVFHACINNDHVLSTQFSISWKDRGNQPAGYRPVVDWNLVPTFSLFLFELKYFYSAFQ